MASKLIPRLGLIVALGAAVGQWFWRMNVNPQYYCYAGGVKTLDDDGIPLGKCFGVKDGRFSRVFSAEEVAKIDGLDVAEGYVLPGLWDGHGHVSLHGQFLHSVDLFGAKTVEEARERLVGRVGEEKGLGTRERWLRGNGWDQNVFGRMPTAADLESDEHLRGLYIMLDRVDLHCSWVSQAVLDLLPPDLGEVPGGEIVREPGMGVLCDNARDLIVALWPQPTKEMRREYIKTAMKELNEVGIVGVHDAGSLPDEVELYVEMAERGELSVRLYSMLECGIRNSFCPENAGVIEREDGMFSMRSVKIFADGALGSWGAALLKPYSDKPKSTGLMLTNATHLAEVTKAWARIGFQVNTHSIGDLANRLAIDAFEQALAAVCPNMSPLECQSKMRFRLEHAQIIHPDDQARMAALGIIPSIQPTHATSDMGYAELRLGRDRTASSAYRMKSLLGLKPILGSDFPVEPPSPLAGMYAAVTRKDPKTGLGPKGTSDEEGWFMGEALGVEEALRGFTTNVARGGFMEGEVGVVKGGARADWVVVDREVSEGMDPEELRSIKVLETWVAGEKVFPKREKTGFEWAEMFVKGIEWVVIRVERVIFPSGQDLPVAPIKV